jgi:hypothetical protein
MTLEYKDLSITKYEDIKSGDVELSKLFKINNTLPLKFIPSIVMFDSKITNFNVLIKSVYKT